LITGAVLQVVPIGGPEPATGLRFSVNQTNIIAVSPNGLIEALIVGDVKLTAKVVDEANVLCEVSRRRLQGF